MAEQKPTMWQCRGREKYRNVIRRDSKHVQMQTEGFRILKRFSYLGINSVGYISKNYAWD